MIRSWYHLNKENGECHKILEKIETKIIFSNTHTQPLSVHVRADGKLLVSDNIKSIFIDITNNNTNVINSFQFRVL